MRADDVARRQEIALQQSGKHRLGHHAGADDAEPNPAKAFLEHVTAHLTANDSPAGGAGRAMIDRR